MGMKLQRGDREVFGTGAAIFSGLALLVAMAALITAGVAYTRSNDAKAKVVKLQAAGVIGSTVGVDLQEFEIKRTPSVVKAGVVTFNVKNVGGITHEMVVVRAPDANALPKITVAGDRSVGAVDEEAVSAVNTIGETGDVKAQKHITKRFVLTPGTYVMFCNIDSKNAAGTVTNHFMKGMSATITVV
jgi:uncharacterized cupredoxin-like copper-binding protein